VQPFPAISPCFFLTMFQCRFYEQEWPEEGEIVVVKVKEVFADGGIYCSLMEYNGIEGYVAISEWTRRQIRSAKQSAMKKGQLDLAKVVKVDPERGYIDLNKEQLPRKVVDKVTIRWNNSKKVHSIMRSVAQRVETPVEELYMKFLWPLARDMKKLNKSTIEGLTCFLKDPGGMTEKYNLRQNFVDALIPRIREMLKPKQHRITALIRANCFSWQGVTLIKRAMKAGALVSTPDCPVQIVLTQPPSTWQIKIHTLKPEEGAIVIWKILEKIRRVLTLGNRGKFRLIKAPIMRDPYKQESLVACQDPKINMTFREESVTEDTSQDWGSAHWGKQLELGNASNERGRTLPEKEMEHFRSELSPEKDPVPRTSVHFLEDRTPEKEQPLEKVAIGSPGFRGLLRKPFTTSTSLFHDEESTKQPLAPLQLSLEHSPQHSSVVSACKVSASLKPLALKKNKSYPRLRICHFGSSRRSNHFSSNDLKLLDSMMSTEPTRACSKCCQPVKKNSVSLTFSQRVRDNRNESSRKANENISPMKFSLCPKSLSLQFRTRSQ